MTNPTEELRTAAATLLNTAAQAPPGPWTIELRHSRKKPGAVTSADLVTPHRTRGITLKYPGCLEEMQWNALTHPGLAEPLAWWLESVAEAADTHAAQGWGNDATEVISDAALAVARVINRSEP